MTEEGFYVLTKDVNNPKPDRRSKRIDSMPVWEKGLRVHLLPPEGRRGRITFEDNSYVSFGGNDPEVDAGNELYRYLEEAEYAIGQTFRFGSLGMDCVLALAFEKGLLTRQQILDLRADLEDMGDKEYAEFLLKHWLV